MANPSTSHSDRPPVADFNPRVVERHDTSSVPRTPSLLEDLTVERLTRRVNLTITRPTPIAPIIELPVPTVNYVNYFRYVYQNLFNALFPGQLVVEDVIDEDNFIIICRRLLQSRVQMVHSQLLNERPGNMPAVLGFSLMPKSIGDLINFVGSCTIRFGSLICVPQDADQPQGGRLPLGQRATVELFHQYSRFVATLHRRNLINVVPLSTAREGTPWWIAGAYSPNIIADGDANTVVVKSVFPELSSEDIMKAAFCQNRALGTIPNYHTALDFRSIQLDGIITDRALYALLA